MNGYFAGQSSDIAQQLLAVAKIIEARASLAARRQVFLVSIGSFDTHSEELRTQQTLLGELGPALKSFHDSMANIGAGASVTSFTLSDFSRTYKPNTNGGTDHAWGNNHFVAGGAVKGGRFYGTWPTLALGSADDVEKVATSDARLICSDEAREIGNELKLRRPRRSRSAAL